MWKGRQLAAVCLLACTACGDASRGSASDGGNARDVPSEEGSEETTTCAPPPPAPSAPLVPVAGELFYAQLGLGGLSMGESAIVVGPDGSVVLLDIGNDSHADDVADALAELTGATSVDHVVITHFHADHGAGLAELLGRVTLRGRVVYRGFTDLTAAANDDTIESMCDALAARPASDTPLCEAATRPPCAPSAWSGTYPTTNCPGIGTIDLALGAGARVDFLAANGIIGTDRYETLVGPLLDDDSNGENARSVVARLSHGDFHMLVAGDLTGGGSDTNDVESFYAARLTGAGVPAAGVDVLHAGHHGRDTSTNATWVERLLPVDGRSRNVIMGISTAHLQSPHAAVLSTVLDGDRLALGRAWTTRVAPGGASAAGLIDASGGTIRIATLEAGSAYAMQAVGEDGTVIESRTFRSLAACR